MKYKVGDTVIINESIKSWRRYVSAMEEYIGVKTIIESYRDTIGSPSYYLAGNQYFWGEDHLSLVKIKDYEPSLIGDLM